MMSGSNHALDGLGEAQNSSVLTLLLAQITLPWSLALIWSKQGSYFDLLQIPHFAILGKTLFLHIGSGFDPWDVLAYKLTFKHTTIPYVTCLGTIGIKLKWFDDLENGFANSELDMSGLCIRVVTNVLTNAK